MSQLPNRISKPGPVLDYLQNLASQGGEGGDIARRTALAVQRVLQTEDGAILLELLEKATTDFFLSPSAESSALDALNSQRFVVLDLRRITTDETQHVLARQQDHAETRGRGRRG
ncbi:MAG: hypothetical protein RI571_06595 [Roseovarius sp.]|nr:hypothetical protein [Roseovarius sp.]